MAHKKDMVKIDDLLEKLDYMKEGKDKIMEAYQYALKKHDGQYRKHDKDTPYVFHPMVVSLILKTADFDEKVIAAGLLHDVVEDTRYNIDDISKLFGGEIASLVMTATEPDKSLPWKERKKQQIKVIKDLPVANKAIVCADKIANLEDLRIQLRKNGYIESANWIITWCVGHLVTMSYPEKYDEKLKFWRLDTLPFMPKEYKYEVDLSGLL